MQLLDSLRRVVKQRPQHLLAVLAERWRGEVDPPLLGNFASEIFDKARQAEQDKKGSKLNQRGLKVRTDFGQAIHKDRGRLAGVSRDRLRAATSSS